MAVYSWQVSGGGPGGAQQEAQWVHHQPQEEHHHANVQKVFYDCLSSVCIFVLGNF